MSRRQKNVENGGAYSRRDFVKASAVLGLGTAFAGAQYNALAQASREIGPAPDHPFAAPPMKTVRIGFVGVGGMGSGHVNNLLKIEGAQITAVCDIVEAKVKRVQKQVESAGFPTPQGYFNGPEDFKRMCAEEELDLVYTATPWEWHVPVCVAAMENGKHAATEVPAAVTLEECWQLVETAEKQQKHCVMMENCCYDRFELAVLHMVRKGLLGELIHAECGYLHDLRDVKFSKDGEGLWRRAHSIARDGNLYPTHGLGPVAQCMNINRGDQFEFMVSISSKSRGLQEYQAKLPTDDPRRNEQYKCGDVNTSLIRTCNGCTITVVHDCNLPRPYSRIFHVQGTKGIAMDYPPRIFAEGLMKEHAFAPMEEFYEQWEHPLRKNLEKNAAGAGHGGMDFIEDYRLIKCLREGLPTDMDVYDAAAWSAVGELSERSAADRGRSQDFPDFTRGKWKTNPPLGIIES